MSTRRALRAALAVTLLLPLGVTVLAAPAAATPVASDDAAYERCGRVFPDPQAYAPSPTALPGESPWAKGNAVCRAVDFIQWNEALAGLEYLESRYPQFVEVYNLREDFAEVLALSEGEGQSAGLPTNTLERDKADLYMVRITDESVPAKDKKRFLYTLSLHGIEKAGLEGGLRAAEDLAAWAAETPEQPIMETLPDSLPAGEAMKRSEAWFAMNNPDGWRRGDTSLGGLAYQRYNGNGVDLNRDWPEKGYTFRPFTPASEPETATFAKVLKAISPTWAGGVDLHGQLIDRAFSFTLLGASQRPYAKNQRMLQFTQGAYEDAETRLAWNPLIKPNDAPEACVPPGTSGTVNNPADGCDPTPRVYGVQYGTIWDTIAYTVTGAIGNWADSDIGLSADFIDNEMSLSHLSNCYTGKCFIQSAEQLHVDGNKSLIYAMINYTLQPEDQRFRFTGRAAYLTQPNRLRHSGTSVPKPSSPLPVQEPIETTLVKDPANDATFEFEVDGPSKGVQSGGLVAKTTYTNVQGVGPGAVLGVAVERFNAEEPEPGGGQWTLVNQDYNQSPLYLQSGMQVDANDLVPGRYRLRVFGPGAALVAATIEFSKGRAWPDPGQVPYDVSNLDFFEELRPHVGPGQLTPLPAAQVAAGASLSAFDTVIAVDRTVTDPRTAKALKAFAEAGGNVVLTDNALTALGQMGIVDPDDVEEELVYAGSVAFTAPDGSSTYEDPLAANVDVPGSAEGPDRRRQTTEPVPTGYAIQTPDGGDASTLPQHGVTQAAWEEAGGRTVGTVGDSDSGNVTFGELEVGKGRIRILGSFLPFPTDEFDHPFGLNDYAITFTAYELAKNTWSWARPGGTTAPPPAAPATGRLPATGADAPWPALVALLGVGLLLVRRKRAAL